MDLHLIIFEKKIFLLNYEIGKNGREVTCLRKLFKSEESILPFGVYYAFIDVRDTHPYMLFKHYVLNKVCPGTTYHVVPLSRFIKNCCPKIKYLSHFQDFDLIIRVLSLIAPEQITT